MSDYKGDNVLEKIGSFVPGYAGYVQREGRRHSDKILRMAIVEEVTAKKRLIDSVVERFTAEGKLAMVPSVDAIRRQLDLIANKLAYANYGTSGFFDTVQIDREDLDRVYEYDIALVTVVRERLQKLDELQTATDIVQTVSGIRDALKHLESLIDGRNKTLLEA